MGLGGDWCRGIMQNNLTFDISNDKHPIDYSILGGSFSPSYLGLVNIIIVFQGVWRVSGKCLGGVWELSE